MFRAYLLYPHAAGINPPFRLDSVLASIERSTARGSSEPQYYSDYVA